MQNGRGGLARLTLLAVGIVILLSGCFKVDVKIALDSKALASGTYKIEVTKEIAALAGITTAQALEDSMLESQDTPMPEGSSIDTKETDTGFEITVTMVDAPMSDSDMGAEVLSDGRIKFSYKQEATDASSGADLGLGSGSMNLEVTFPGKVVESSSDFKKVDDNTVSLSTTLDKTIDVFAISEPDGSGSGSSSPVVPIIVGIVVLALIGVAISRKRTSAATGVDAEPKSPDQPII